MLPVELPAAVGANWAVNVALCPAEILAGRVNPIALYPVPDALRAEIVNVAFPEFVRVTVWVDVLPTLTFPKAMLAGLIVSWGCEAVPVPLRETTRGEPGALLVMETPPVALPAEVGANFAVNDALAFALIVCGKERPLMLKPVPEAVAAEIVMLAVPAFDKVTGTEPLAPTKTLPKLTLAGLAESCPCVPVPLKAMLNVGSVALLEIVIVAEELPAVVGVKVATNPVLSPAVRVKGVEAPLNV